MSPHGGGFRVVTTESSMSKVEVSARELVPGDVVRGRLGDIISADVKLMDGDYWPPLSWQLVLIVWGWALLSTANRHNDLEADCRAK